MILQLALAFISTFAFAVLFSAPKTQYVFCGLCGAFTWGMYLLFQNFGYTTVISALFATFFLTLLARILSIVKKNPVTIYLITGIFPLVPGAGIYYTSYYLIMNEGTRSLYGTGNLQNRRCHCPWNYFWLCRSIFLEKER